MAASTRRATGRRGGWGSRRGGRRRGRWRRLRGGRWRLHAFGGVRAGHGVHPKPSPRTGPRRRTPGRPSLMLDFRVADDPSAAMPMAASTGQSFSSWNVLRAGRNVSGRAGTLSGSARRMPPFASRGRGDAGSENRHHTPSGASGLESRGNQRMTRRRLRGPRREHGGDRCLRRFRVLLAPRGRARGEDRHAVRRALGFDLPGRGRGPAGRVPAAARSPSHDPAAQDQLPRQRLGDAFPRGQGCHLALRGGLAPARGQAGRLRGLRPVRGPHVGPGRHVLRRPDRDPPVVGRDLRPGAARARDRHDPRPRHPRPRDGHGRRHPGARASRPSPNRSGSATPAGRSST